MVFDMNTWKKIINKENKWNHMVETDVEGPVEKVARNEIVQAMQKMATGPSEVSVEMIVASGKIGVK